MDAFYLLLIAAFCAAVWGLMAVCHRLEARK